MIEELRQRLQALQRPPGLEDGPGTVALGVAAIDDILGGGLTRGALHEIAAVSEAHVPTAAGFAAAVAGLAGHDGRARSSVWIAEDMALTESGALYGAGLEAFGLFPERLVTVAATQRRDLLWAMEEALRCRSIGAVIGEMRDGAIDGVAVRRLSLAAAESGALAIVLRATSAGDASTAATRWIVGAAPSAATAYGLGAPRFAVHLMRNRRGPSGSWIIEWSESDACFALATDSQPVAAPVFDRPHRQVA